MLVHKNRKFLKDFELWGEFCKMAFSHSEPTDPNIGTKCNSKLVAELESS
jgi:hypothetical protein